MLTAISHKKMRSNYSLRALVEKREKGFIVWLKGGALSVDPDILAHILIPGQLSTQISPKRSFP